MMKQIILFCFLYIEQVAKQYLSVGYIADMKMYFYAFLGGNFILDRLQWVSTVHGCGVITNSKHVNGEWNSLLIINHGTK